MFKQYLLGIKNEKNHKITIPKGSFLYDIYFKLWDYPSLAFRKSTQSGISTWANITSFEHAKPENDSKNTFYMLPVESTKNRYLSRVDEVIANNDYLKSGIGNVDNKSIKKYHNAILNYVYCAPSQLVEFPADILIIDEIDEMTDDWSRAYGRLGFSKYRYVRKIGNPTIPKAPIDDAYINSTQSKWNVKHDCGHWILPDYFKHIADIEGNTYDRNFTGYNELLAICHMCGKPIDFKSSGEWVKTYDDRKTIGIHINKLFSGNTPLIDLHNNHKEGLVNESKMTSFMNNDLGLPHVSSGQKINSDMLNRCIDATYTMPDTYDNPALMGIDVGKVLHTVIMSSDYRLLFVGELQNENDVLILARQYNVRIGVIDAMPELRLVDKILSSHAGFFKCRYMYNTAKPYDAKPINRQVSIDRTFALDLVKENVLKQTYKFPMNIASVKDFYSHIESLTRVVKDDRSIWIEQGADHLAHSLVYATLAGSLWTYINNINT